jgi:hypothetical protein
MSATADDYGEVFRRLQAPIARSLDCGRKCAPLNQGIPVCCDHEQAIPIVDAGEWDLLRARTTMWSVYTPRNKTEVKEFGDGSDGCKAIVCRGVKHCERDNRSLACRTFPFFPYFKSPTEFFGLAYYWTFEGLCWVVSNLQVVERPFIGEMIEAHEVLFARDPEWRKTYIDYSATMRGVFTKKKRRIPLLGRDGALHWVLPGSGGQIVCASGDDPAAHLPKFNGDAA